jgi:hypothetical protein
MFSWLTRDTFREAPGKHADAIWQMAIFLQPVVIPKRCYLFEVLLWVAFQRLPVATSDMEGKDIRDSDENRGSGQGGYEINAIDTYIFDEECEYAGIPPDPSWRAVIED